MEELIDWLERVIGDLLDAAVSGEPESTPEPAKSCSDPLVPSPSTSSPTATSATSPCPTPANITSAGGPATITSPPPPFPVATPSPSSSSSLRSNSPTTGNSPRERRGWGIGGGIRCIIGCWMRRGCWGRRGSWEWGRRLGRRGGRGIEGDRWVILGYRCIVPRWISRLYCYTLESRLFT